MSHQETRANSDILEIFARHLQTHSRGRRRSKFMCSHTRPNNMSADPALLLSKQDGHSILAIRQSTFEMRITDQLNITLQSVFLRRFKA